MFPFWAKLNPTIDLTAHSQQVKIAMYLLCTNYYRDVLIKWSKDIGCTYQDLVDTFIYLAVVHDIGKIHPIFQSNHGKYQEIINQFKEYGIDISKYPLEDRYRHEYGSKVALTKIWKDDSVFPPIYRDLFGEVILNHHQNTNNSKAGDFIWKAGEDYDNSWWRNEIISFEKSMREKYPPYSFKNVKNTNLYLFGYTLTGILIHADWMASAMYHSDNLTFEEHNTVLDIMNKIATKKVIHHKSIHELFDFISDENIRPLQKAIVDMLKNPDNLSLCTIIEAPMGEGKTEASLLLACALAEKYNKSGIYYALPTMASSNMMMKRFTSFVKKIGKEDPKLIHSLSWLEKVESKESYKFLSINDEILSRGQAFVNSAKLSMYGDVGVGTVDQALSAVMRNAHSMVKMNGLLNKVLIIDEMHAYDAYMLDLIKVLLKCCREHEIPVIILSATLPLNKKKELLGIYSDNISNISTAYPVVTSINKDNKLSQVEMEASYHRDYEINVITAENYIQTVVDRSLDFYNKNAGCTCIITNTVDSAQEIYLKIKENISEDNCLLFHSRFNVATRKQIEDKIGKLFGKNSDCRPEKFILIATQVVEQSLDLDFDHMISELSPIDLLLQRLGRLFRHPNTKRPFTITHPSIDIICPKFNSEEEVNRLIYFPIILKRTFDVIKDTKIITIPNDIRRLTDTVYKEECVNKFELESWMEKQASDEQSATSCKINSIENDLDNLIFENWKNSYTTYNSESEELEMLHNSTRDTSDSMKIAILPKKLYKQLVEMGDNVNKELAKEVYSYVVGTSTSQKRKILSHMTEILYTCNNKYLWGINFIEASNDAESPLETLVYNGQISVSNILGLRINFKNK